MQLLKFFLLISFVFCFELQADLSKDEILAPRENARTGQRLDDVEVVEKLDPQEDDKSFFESLADRAGDWFDFVRKKLAILEVSIDQKIGDLKLNNHANFGLNYGVGLNFVGQDTVYRVDKLRLNFDLQPGDFFDFDQLPINFGISSMRELVYIRPFPSVEESAKSAPFHLSKIPFTAEKAKSMSEGSFFSIPAHMNLYLGSNLATTLGFVSAGVGGKVFAQGEFIFHIFKLEQDRVRLRIMSAKSRGSEINAGISVPLKIVGIKPVNNLIAGVVENFVELDLLELGAQKTHSDILIVDYVFDLSQTEAAQAYNAVMGNSYELNLNKILNKEFFQDRGIIPIAKLDTLDELAKNEETKPYPNRKVTKLFNAKNHVENLSFNLGASVILANADFQTNFQTNRLVFDDYKKPRNYFFIPSYSASSNQEYGFRFFKNGKRQNHVVLFDSDNMDENFKFHSYGVSYYKSITLAHSDHVERIIRHLETNFPHFVLQGLEFEKLKSRFVSKTGAEAAKIEEIKLARENLEKFYASTDLRRLRESDRKKETELKEALKKANGSFFDHFKPDLFHLSLNYQVFFKKEALRKIAHYKHEDLEAAFDAYWKVISLYFPENFVLKYIRDTAMSIHVDAMLDVIAKFFEKISANQYLIPETSSNKFMELRINPLFQNYGLGFMFYLLSKQRDLSDVCYISIILSLNNAIEKVVTIGDRNDPIYHYIQYNDYALGSGNMSGANLQADALYLKLLLGQ